MLGVDLETFAADPFTLVPLLQDYVARLPLSEFEQSDWVTLHTDLTSFLAEILVKNYGGNWEKVEASDSPAGFRYYIVATGLDGLRRRVEPYDVVMEEFQHPPIEITRMIANAGAFLGVISSTEG
ncbi:hypothetical protein [Streptomyces boninensis]|uniref:hypothetical protein n=1 Tax=Streptomyces boninensis TaxID=2039455 RepID=UPI003B2153B2